MSGEGGLEKNWNRLSLRRGRLVEKKGSNGSFLIRRKKDAILKKIDRRNTTNKRKWLLKITRHKERREPCREHIGKGNLRVAGSTVGVHNFTVFGLKRN